MTTQAPKVAIITGSSRGIGASIAKRLAANGITVVVNYAGRAVDADQVVNRPLAAAQCARGARDHDDHEHVLVAFTGAEDKEPVPEMIGDERYEHGADHGRRCQWRDQSQHQEGPRPEFGGSGR